MFVFIFILIYIDCIFFLYFYINFMFLYFYTTVSPCSLADTIEPSGDAHLADILIGSLTSSDILHFLAVLKEAFCNWVASQFNHKPHSKLISTMAAQFITSTFITNHLQVLLCITAAKPSFAAPCALQSILQSINTTKNYRGSSSSAPPWSPVHHRWRP